jgi:NADH dehydrogenase FAD-containing subunit
MRNALKARAITVLQDVATAIRSNEVLLGCGAGLACDVSIVATGTQAPTWLASSGLQLDAEGYVVVNAFHQSASHAGVFAVGDICSRTDRPVIRNGAQAVRAGPALAHNLASITSGQAMREDLPPANSLNLLFCGDHYAIGCWGGYSFEGRMAWWLKNWIDRRFVARYRQA